MATINYQVASWCILFSLGSCEALLILLMAFLVVVLEAAIN
jgi:hypothetical protein